MRDQNIILSSNVSALQLKSSKSADKACDSFQPEEGVRLMRAFACIQDPQDRRAVILLAEQLASK
jgi:hypothetical protein